MAFGLIFPFQYMALPLMAGVLGGAAGKAAILGQMLCAALGFCAALAGVVYTFYTSSGNSTSAAGLELDAIASVVIGGTLKAINCCVTSGLPL